MRTRVPMPTDLITSGPTNSPSRDPNRLMLSRLAFLRVEIDEQDHVRHMLAESGLDRMMHLDIRMHRALSLDADPVVIAIPRPRTRGRRGVT